MRFQPEPHYQHGSAHQKIAIIYINLGTPDEPTPSALRKYLKPFLWDRRVVEVPRPIWWLILHGIILPFRAKKSAEKYASIWTKDGSPLLINTAKQAKLLQGYLGEKGHQVKVVYAMRYGNPSIPSVLAQLKKEAYSKILILPAYPQYSGTTTASNFDAVTTHYQNVRNLPELRFIRSYHDDAGYIQALRASVLRSWEKNGKPEKLIMSFHGLPKKFLLNGDPYHCECYKTARLLAEQLGLKSEDYIVTFQSRLGKAEWLKPYTEPTVIELAKKGVKRIDVICPAFIADCLETLEEIQMEVKTAFLTAGGKDFHYIPCLNDSPEGIHALTHICEQHLQGWPSQLSAEDHAAQKQQNAISAHRAQQMGAPH